MTDTNFIKTCSKCKESKSVTSFYKIGDGYRSHCIDCMKEKRNEIKSNLIVIIPDAKTCTRCKENKASDDFHHDGTKKDGLAVWCKSCKQKYDLEKKSIFMPRKIKSPSNSSEYRKKWNKENSNLKKAYTANRRALLKKATPNFSDQEEIKRFYLDCPNGMEVDHIIPLTSKIVCGLHVPNNLQYLTRIDNIKKGNKFPIEDK